MSLEHADPKKRGFLTSFTNTGAPSGALWGTLIMSAVSGMLTDEQFMAWGWRIPFVLSAVLVVIGLMIRSRISGNPLFLEAPEKEKTQPSRDIPLISVLKTPRVLLIAMFELIEGLLLQWPPDSADPQMRPCL